MWPEPLAAVTFDFWETLVEATPDNFRRSTERRMRSLAEVLAGAGCDLPRAALEDAHARSRRLIAERFWTTCCEPTIQDQVRLFFDCVESGLCERLDAPTFARVVDAYATPVLEYPPSPMPGAVDALSALAARGLRLGIVSNTGRIPGVVLRRILERHDMLRYFEAAAMAYSDEVGFRKPDARIFARALQGLAVDPARTLHIGDNPDADVLGARASGLRTAHYTFAGTQPSTAADLIVPSLADLPDLLLR